MDQNGIRLIFRQFTRKKELFYTSYSLNSFFQIGDLYRLLILIDKYYNYLLKDGFNKLCDWHNIEHFDFKNNNVYKLYISPRLYFTDDNELRIGIISDAFCITIIPNSNYFSFDLYTDLYTNINYRLDENNSYYKINQSQAAKKNREILSSFLFELEKVLDGYITEYSTTYYLTKESIFKYGLTENATLIDDDYKDEL